MLHWDRQKTHDYTTITDFESLYLECSKRLEQFFNASKKDKLEYLNAFLLHNEITYPQQLGFSSLEELLSVWEPKMKDTLETLDTAADFYLSGALSMFGDIEFDDSIARVLKASLDSSFFFLRDEMVFTLPSKYSFSPLANLASFANSTVYLQNSEVTLTIPSSILLIKPKSYARHLGLAASLLPEFCNKQESVLTPSWRCLNLVVDTEFLTPISLLPLTRYIKSITFNTEQIYWNRSAYMPALDPILEVVKNCGHHQYADINALKQNGNTIEEYMFGIGKRIVLFPNTLYDTNKVKPMRLDTLTVRQEPKDLYLVDKDCANVGLYDYNKEKDEPLFQDCHIGRLTLFTSIDKPICQNCHIEELHISSDCQEISNAFQGCQISQIKGANASSVYYGPYAFKDCTQPQTVSRSEYREKPLRLSAQNKYTPTSFEGSEDLLTAQARLRYKKFCKQYQKKLQQP